MLRGGECKHPKEYIYIYIYMELMTPPSVSSFRCRFPESTATQFSLPISEFAVALPISEFAVALLIS